MRLLPELRDAKGGRWQAASRTHCGSRVPPRSFGFTLIEIMVAIGIIAIVMAIGIPSVFQQLHKDSMRKAVADVNEACSHARARAVLDGMVTELRIRPADRQISVVAGSAAKTTGDSSYSFEGEELVEHKAGSSAAFSAKLSDHILIEFIGVNLIPDLQQAEEVSCFFYPNGTSDELVLLLRSDQGEIRKITTDVITGIADVEVIK